MKSGTGIFCIILAIVFLGIGIYLVPAAMWRNFSIAAFVIGVVLLAAGIVLIRKNRR